MQQDDMNMSSSSNMKQQQQAQQSNQHQLLSLNFDDDNELSNLAGMVDDEDLPDVFWDYADVGNIGYSDDGNMSTHSSAAGDSTSKMTSTALSTKKGQAASVTDHATASSGSGDNSGNTNSSNTNNANANNTNSNTNATSPSNATATASQRAAAAALSDAANSIDINNLNNYLTSFAQPGLSGGLGGYPFLPLNVNGSFQPSTFSSVKPVSVSTTTSNSNTNNNVNVNLASQQQQQQQQQQSQHPATQQQQQQQAVPASQLVNNMLATNQNNGNTNTTNQHRQQQQQPQQQQPQPQQTLQNTIFGVNPSVFNPQVVFQSIQPQHQQQANNQHQQQVTNLQYLQQQIQGNNAAAAQQQQLVQQQLFQNSALIQGNNPSMLPPQQLQLQPQQINLQQQQQQSQQQQSKNNQNNSMQQQQQQQQVYPSQLLPLAPGGSQSLSQGGGRQSTNSSIPKPTTLTSNSQLNSYQGQKHSTSTSSKYSTKNVQAVVVSSSDTDCDHTVSSSASGSKTKKSTRSPNTASNSLSIDMAQFAHDGLSSSHTNSSDAKRMVKDSGSGGGDENLTEEERALANRKRNREHARNTRARKKAYLESLKHTLDELCKERDSLVSERAGAASLLLEIQKTRTDVLLSFFAMRSTYEKRRSLWSSILDESFTCVLPVTPYRSFPASEVQISKCQRTIMGVDGMIADTASMHVLLNSLIDRSKYPAGKVEFGYTLIAEEAVVSGSQMMARWSMSTTNFAKLGAKKEIRKMGMLCARFNSAHKIVSLELMFDVMAFMLQLKQSAGASAFTVVPNTVQTCIGPFGNMPMVMTLADRPYTIVQVNEEWEKMTGYKAEDVVGKESCKILQSDGTEKKAVEDLMTSIHYQRPAFSVLTNYAKDKKRKFRNFIAIYPLSADSKITHYVGLTLHTELLETASGTTLDPANGADAEKQKVVIVHQTQMQQIKVEEKQEEQEEQQPPQTRININTPKELVGGGSGSKPNTSTTTANELEQREINSSNSHSGAGSGDGRPT